MTPQLIFESSTTTGQKPSKHHLCDPLLYKQSAELGFSHVFGLDVSELRWLGLLPSYMDRPTASLVYMVEHFAHLGGGRLYNKDLESLAWDLEENESQEIPSILIGVTFALLECARSYPLKLTNTIVMETGGMKGRGEELPRNEVHSRLSEAFGVAGIASEYGMTELSSQAWSLSDGLFRSAPTLRIHIRDLRDPLSFVLSGERGGINCIDLANIDTCAFIATDDIGLQYSDGSFEVLGRIDGSEQRGCNLMFTAPAG